MFRILVCLTCVMGLAVAEVDAHGIIGGIVNRIRARSQFRQSVYVQPVIQPVYQQRIVQPVYTQQIVQPVYRQQIVQPVYRQQIVQPVVQPYCAPAQIIQPQQGYQSLQSFQQFQSGY